MDCVNYAQSGFYILKKVLTFTFKRKHPLLTLYLISLDHTSSEKHTVYLRMAEKKEHPMHLEFILVFQSLVQYWQEDHPLNFLLNQKLEKDIIHSRMFASIFSVTVWRLKCMKCSLSLFFNSFSFSFFSVLLCCFLNIHTVLLENIIGVQPKSIAKKNRKFPRSLVTLMSKNYCKFQ